jgi:hypothetical protein
MYEQILEQDKIPPLKIGLDVVLPLPPVLPIFLDLLQAFPLCFRDEEPTEEQGSQRK